MKNPTTCWMILTSWCLIASSPTLAESAPRPNVLFIAVDDLNDWVDCLGGYPGEVHTPNIDRLAAKGLLFENAHCPAPVCNPSRTAILTGLRPSTTGIYDNGRWWRPTLPNATTIPEFFGKQGYEVAGGGKIFHHTPGFNPPEQWDEHFRQVFDDPWHRAKPKMPSQSENRLGRKVFRSRVSRMSAAANVHRPTHESWTGGLSTNRIKKWGMGRWSSGPRGSWQSSTNARSSSRQGFFDRISPGTSRRKYFELYPLNPVKLLTVPDDDLDDIPEAGLENGQLPRR